MSEPRAAAVIALRIAVGMLLTAAVGAVAHLPVGSAAEHAALRIALRTPRAQIEVCRDRTDDELSSLPRHMRQRRQCEVTTVDYRLRIEIDGVVRIERPVVHRGVRHNRPLVADELIAVEPGRRKVTIRFTPETGALSDAGAPAPPAAVYDGPIEFAAGRIRVLALDADASSFGLSG